MEKSVKISFNCDICNFGFKTISNLKMHYESLHEGKKPFTCDICGKDSSSIKGLGIHKRDKHGIPI